jgi:Ser/Thr protein kinase RdoA (MazF antagonist)
MSSFPSSSGASLSSADGGLFSSRSSSSSSSSSQEEEARKAWKPVVSNEAALRLLQSSWQVPSAAVTKLTRLDSYDDVNFAVTTSRGERFTLKIHNGVESSNRPFLEAQNQIMTHLFGKGVTCPTPVSAAEETMAMHTLPTRAGGTKELAVRLLTWVTGDTMSDSAGSPETLAAAGAFLGRMSSALATFDHPVRITFFKFEVGAFSLTTL